ncbi:DUF6412 domain-containing protein [Thermostaphylospora chromogena]|uniref:Uncharacterized protein n=1 Tax=Thermostaphylospora chromogena TaxID=35622 RepID=A0A1H1CUM0_9ACTN|nr:DUF6412 domain-containing protein [Thermostaphylospora chromogena]SDQ67987.1 hypothetical protein SAMN04489764_1659 [Thermostaphylospora chromogena]
MTAITVARMTALASAVRLHLLALAIVAVGTAGDSSGVLTVAAVAGLSAILLRLAARAAGVGAPLDPWAPLSVRDRARRTTVVRQRDPDAAGRPRPRAPTASPARA